MRMAGRIPNDHRREPGSGRAVRIGDSLDARLRGNDFPARVRAFERPSEGWGLPAYAPR
jgi:hypothetical protein